MKKTFLLFLAIFFNKEMLSSLPIGNGSKNSVDKIDEDGFLIPRSRSQNEMFKLTYLREIKKEANDAILLANDYLATGNFADFLSSIDQYVECEDEGTCLYRYGSQFRYLDHVINYEIWSNENLLGLNEIFYLKANFLIRWAHHDNFANFLNFLIDNYPEQLILTIQQLNTLLFLRVEKFYTNCDLHELRRKIIELNQRVFFIESQLVVASLNQLVVNLNMILI